MNRTGLRLFVENAILAGRAYKVIACRKLISNNRLTHAYRTFSSKREKLDYHQTIGVIQQISFSEALHYQLKDPGGHGPQSGATSQLRLKFSPKSHTIKLYVSHLIDKRIPYQMKRWSFWPTASIL